MSTEPPLKKKKRKKSKGPSINSRKKGAVGELAFVNFLKAAALNAHRSQQFCGQGEDSSDVICDEMPHIHWEIKNTQFFQPFDALEQAERDRDAHKMPLVAYKRNHKDWLIVGYASDIIAMLKESVWIEKNPEQLQLEEEITNSTLSLIK